MSKAEETVRPRHGTTSDLRAGVITTTVTHADGSQTVTKTPAAPKK